MKALESRNTILWLQVNLRASPVGAIIVCSMRVDVFYMDNTSLQKLSIVIATNN